MVRRRQEERRRLFQTVRSQEKRQRMFQTVRRQEERQRMFRERRQHRERRLNRARHAYITPIEEECKYRKAM